jgi:signal transduction histidine kinase
MGRLEIGRLEGRLIHLTNLPAFQPSILTHLLLEVVYQQVTTERYLMLKSIRWQLPLSYAAIALLTVLALGVVLLATLRSFYTQQELNYLARNAQQISPEMARMVWTGLPPDGIQAQLKNFSFLSQARVRLLDAQGQPLADSGEPLAQPEVAALSVKVKALAAAPGDVLVKPFTAAVKGMLPADDYASFIYIQRPDTVVAPADMLLTRTLIITRTNGEEEIFHWEFSRPVTGTQVITAEAGKEVFAVMGEPGELSPPPDFISVVPAIRPLFGASPAVGIALAGPRSDQAISQPFDGPAGELLGYAELSQGPAYGREILTSVAWSWAIAGGVAVALAAGAGWLISRRLSSPLLALADVTGRMAQGNLSVRAEVARPAPAEVGLLARSFNEMADQVEETVLTLRRFVADAAHELHTPLTALRTNLELVNGGEANSAPYIQQAQAQVERLERLTRDLLDLSKLETGSGETHFAPLSLNTLVQETGELYASRAEQAGLAFSLVVPEQLVAVKGNETHLRRALSNLLDNALKFTPAGGVIRLGLQVIDAPGEGPDRQWAEIWVEDNGIGVSPDDGPQLFSRFYRGRNAAAYPGSGLGLAIVKAIAEGHHGQVLVEDRMPGVCFRLRLPLA